MSQDLSLELPQLLERLHRRYLDVVRIELTRIGARDINPVQVMMLVTIGAVPEMSVRDLIERGYYLGSNASYNIKNLYEGGYIERLTDEHDRRSARVRLTEKGLRVLTHMKKMDDEMTAILAPDDAQKAAYRGTVDTLRRFERECSNRVQS